MIAECFRRVIAQLVIQGENEDLAIKNVDTTRRVVAELRKKLELNFERAST